MNPGAGFLISRRSRAKVRRWFHEQDRDEHREAGERILEQTIKRLHVDDDNVIGRLTKHFHQSGDIATLINIGRGEIRQTQLDGFFQPNTQNARIRKPAAHSTNSSVGEVLGVSGLLTRVANCCKPIPGDVVIGYITQGAGITIHRKDCSNIINIREDRRERLVAVDWGKQDVAYRVNIELELQALDRSGLLNDVTNKLVSLDVPIVRIDSNTDPDTQLVLMNLSVQLASAKQLGVVINRLTQIQSVRQVSRV